ncbi:MAG TPA: hypothetical protein VJR89_11755, partial [Polyangiales bacterium]|nr:hypothetical protein [Polyangiales bacterium]
ERMLADAALGASARARQQCDALLARHAGTGPLALGALHETRARIALLERDSAAAREHVEALQRCYAPTQIASLIELANQLAQQLERADAQPEAGLVLFGDDAHLITRLRLILTHTEATFEARAQRGLSIALDLTGAQAGFVVSPAAPGGVVFDGQRPPPSELLDWARLQLAAAGDEQTELITEQTVAESGVLTFGGARYCVVPLPYAPGHEPAAIVLGFDGAPRVPSRQVLAILASHL